MKITVVGIGYVGLSLAILLSQKNNVVALDIDAKKVEMVNNRISPINDKDVVKYLKERKLNLNATTDLKNALKNSDYVIICTPTNYNSTIESFDTSSVENIIKQINKMKINTTIIIKSTVPVGFTENMKKKYMMHNIIFSPEFLREGNALHDNLYPSRIIIGGRNKSAYQFANILEEVSLKKDVDVLFMNSSEAEAVKLFSNTYLALRIAFFNELDTFAEVYNLNSKDIIEGVCKDPRIGNYYNNPSFGYGGYCLPKDTKQLLRNYKNVPQTLIRAVIESNDLRKNFIAKKISSCKPKCVGIYRLTMKKSSDNFRESSIIDIMKKIVSMDIKVIIYEPNIKNDNFNGFKITNDLNEFEKMSDIILANRKDSITENFSKTVYSRDLFMEN
ncbi:MAG TPA: nucleotide sugar dehydrogenase [Candidatus Fimihabitans intestinipullorum]|uniref:UDP-glucose 6-dehydrogenase n=1 Tax=Candidatus Fimihabitans intestinipullorum TaxID=2840820 RepID=A0A9D1HVT3_9BACT|nr:nucleotide sugar dehydrogenase [Candidatus Fimihabitans intestinipullorum]